MIPATKAILLAIGGNSLTRAGEKGTIREQFANAQLTAAAVVGLIRAGYQIIITHGNGPQVGAALLRSERAADQVPGHPLDVCVAATQGEIGYVLQQSLESELQAARLPVPVATVLTQCVVVANDPAMLHPTKPVGPFYSQAEAEERKRTLGWEIVEDAGRGYRRVVPSPDPFDIVELQAIRDLVRQGVLVIACGGGGIPVLRDNGKLRGVEAVIDKDRASALLATRLGLDVLAISTDEPCVYLDYKKPSQRPLSQVTASELEAHYHSGHFPAGNMGPKVESALRFLRDGGKHAVITSYSCLLDAFAGRAGTHIFAEKDFQQDSSEVPFYVVEEVV
ncbi:MAG: carbamate kinase [Acidobacteria bacterium]|nr:carbamate kinase [Acidobacteriota bacterium]